MSSDVEKQNLRVSRTAFWNISHNRDSIHKNALSKVLIKILYFFTEVRNEVLIVNLFHLNAQGFSPAAQGTASWFPRDENNWKLIKKTCPRGAIRNNNSETGKDAKRVLIRRLNKFVDCSRFPLPPRMTVRVHYLPFHEKFRNYLVFIPLACDLIWPLNKLIVALKDTTPI